MREKTIPELPPSTDLESKRILRRVSDANRDLAELNGFSRTIPNRHILINALSLQEAKDSSEIENIITTTDELYRAELFGKESVSLQAKEVRNYANALSKGFGLVSKGEMLTVNNICAIQESLEGNRAGLRRQMGTTLKNATTGEVVYTPPQNHEDILRLMKNLELYINDGTFGGNLDPLIKMAVIHYQFESIHPFYDGNGRTGRILNVLYLVLQKLLDAPILYLSRYIITHKADYYRYLQNVRQTGDWESFILFMLDAVVETSQMTTQTVTAIGKAMTATKQLVQRNFKFYSRDVVESLYLFPYTRIGHFQERLKISRNTATVHLNALSDAGILEKVQLGRNLYFINRTLFAILAAIPGQENSNQNP